jgi:glutamate racemase
VKRQYTRDLITQWAQKCHVRLVGSTQLARLAEAYMRDGFVDEDAVRAEILPCFLEQDNKRTDIVVLACTHYPFLANRMRKVAPWPVDWLDPAEAIARRAMTLLNKNGPVGARTDDTPDRAMFTSGKVGAATRRLLQGFGLTLAEGTAVSFDGPA